jgi:hypothetical protein
LRTRRSMPRKKKMPKQKRSEITCRGVGDEHESVDGEDLKVIYKNAYMKLLGEYDSLEQKYQRKEQKLKYMQGLETEDLSEEQLEKLREDLEAAMHLVVAQKRHNEACKEVAKKFKGFVCPISGKLMKEPVVASDGYSYDKASIEPLLGCWIRNGEEAISPQTMLPFPTLTLVPNHALRKSIDEAVELYTIPY